MFNNNYQYLYIIRFHILQNYVSKHKMLSVFNMPKKLQLTNTVN